RLRPGLRRVPVPRAALPLRRRGLLVEADRLPDRALGLVQAEARPLLRGLLPGLGGREPPRLRLPRAPQELALLPLPALHGPAPPLLRASLQRPRDRARGEPEPEPGAGRGDAPALPRRDRVPRRELREAPREGARARPLGLDDDRARLRPRRGVPG